MAGTVAVVVAIAIAVLAGGGYSAIKRELVSQSDPTTISNPPSSVADQIVYTARTANDAAIVLPAAVQANLLQAGLDHQAIELVQVGYTGNASPSYMDMTPRTGPLSTDPPLRIHSRALSAVDEKITDVQADVNSPAVGPGGRALLAGLIRTTFSDARVIIVSSGLDLANPDNFRRLEWSVPPSVVVSDVRNAGDLPALRGPVTFVLVPTNGAQQQLGQAQKNYIQAVWTALLKAAGATSVTFIDATETLLGPTAPSAPTVKIPPLTGTPIPQVPVGNNQVTCTVPDTFFVFGKAKLISPAQTVQNLTPCIDAALAAHATFALDGWASYEGPLNADGQPKFNWVQLVWRE